VQLSSPRLRRNKVRRTTVANFPAITHVALTVTDLDRSAVWYERLLGVEPVLDEDAGGFHHKVYPLSGGMLLGLHLHPGGDNAE